MGENTTIKSRREKMGYSQSRFAGVSGVNVRTLQDYEQGRKSIASVRADVLYRISTALGCSMEELLLETAGANEAEMQGRIYLYSAFMNRALDLSRGSRIHTPFDDVFRTLAVDCRSLLIPVVNLAYGEDYDVSALVEPGQNEHMTDRDSGDTSRIVSDSNFVILEKNGVRRRYQIECQSRTDHSILLRLFEYATAIAVENGEISERKLTIAYPRSALIYLRQTANTPDEMEIELQTPGGTVSWKVPVVKTGNYSIDEIFERQLYVMVPFYLLTYEKELAQMERNSEKRRELRGRYEDIFRRLEEAVARGNLNTYQFLTIRNLSKHICEHMTGEDSKIRKELMEIMGGRVLNYEAKDILNRGISEGISQGICALIEACQELNASFEVTAEKLKSKYNLSDSEVQENMDRYWG